jgi:hypothetical protein
MESIMKTQAEFFVAIMDVIWDAYGPFHDSHRSGWDNGIMVARLMGGKEVATWITATPARMVQYAFPDQSRVDMEVINGAGASTEVVEA